MNTLKLTAEDVLKRYTDEDLPEFVEIDLIDVNQRGNFGNTPLHVACVRGRIDEVKALLEAGAEINAKGELDNTPLHEAVGQNNIMVVNELLQRGASLELTNLDGNTAKDIAVLLQHKEIVSLILEGKK